MRVVGPVEGMSQARSTNSVHRVVLVGKTGLDAALRLDEHFELSRVADLREALAEVTIAGADAAATGEGGCTVVVSEGLWSQDAARRARFIDLARAGCAGVRVLRQVTNGTLDSEGGDGVVSLHATPEAIRAAVRGEPHPQVAPMTAAASPVTTSPAMAAPAAAPKVVSAISSSQTPPLAPAPLTPAATPLSPASSAPKPGAAPTLAPARSGLPAIGVGDARIVDLLLQGQEIDAEALSLIRERLRDPAAEFVPHGQAGEVATSAFSGTQCPVVFGQGDASATYGLLRSARASLADVTAQAAWLAGWLRLRDQQAQLREAAFTDPLTGAWNRRYFDRFMANAIDHARSHRHFLTVFVFDLDNFKKYNDQFGHEAGDQILRQTVQLLRSVVRPTDRVCRLGGDEFVVIFDEPEGSRQEGSRHPTSVAELAKRFQRQLAAHRFPQLSQVPPGSLTISGGLATFPWDGSSAEDLLQAADRLLIQSKRQGKNVIELGGLGGA